jgi:hypothetical protein
MLWFYFDDITSKIRAILFPKKTILKEIYKETLEIKDEPKIEIMKEIKNNTDTNTWFDILDYIFWGDQNFKEKLKTEGIWKTLWEPYIKPNNTNQIISETTTQPLSTYEAVIKTDDMIKENTIKSVTHIQQVLSEYFQNNLSWIDYLIIQGFKFIAILVFFLSLYLLFTFLFHLIKKDKTVK